MVIQLLDRGRGRIGVKERSRRGASNSLRVTGAASALKRVMPSTKSKFKDA